MKLQNKDHFIYKNIDISYYAFSSNKEDPLLLLNSDQEKDTLIKMIEEKGKTPFHLLIVKGFDWENDLAPYPTKELKDKGGNASSYLKLVEEILLYAKENYNLSPKHTACIGYSLAGLFAIYAAINSSSFDYIASISGSLWYKDFLEYVKEKGIDQNVKKVVLSLGDKESSGKGIFSSVEDNTVKLKEYLESLNIDASFSLNKGNHFSDIEERIVKGINELL